jgi:glycosyltransferase involved in cell wall biosynthesis
VIKAAGVVIPAHNEEDLLPACLAAVRHSARTVTGLPVHIVVAADACTDRTADLARETGATVVEIGARSVGAAREAGMREVLGLTRSLDPEEVWLATTDADTMVPADWLVRQLGYAAAGWDAVVGTVTVTGWAEHPPEIPPLFYSHYATARGTHSHVHGANLGFRAGAYLAAGGFLSSPTAEDHALVDSLTAVGRRVLRTTEVSVVTSARRRARAPHGFSHLLSTLAVAQPEPGSQKDPVAQTGP